MGKAAIPGAIPGGGGGDFESGDGDQHTIYIQSSTPSDPSEDDIWIDTS